MPLTGAANRRPAKIGGKPARDCSPSLLKPMLRVVGNKSRAGTLGGAPMPACRRIDV